MLQLVACWVIGCSTIGIFIKSQLIKQFLTSFSVIHISVQNMEVNQQSPLDRNTTLEYCWIGILPPPPRALCQTFIQFEFQMDKKWKRNETGIIDETWN